MKLIHIVWFVLVCLFSNLSQRALADDVVIHHSTHLSPDDYLMQSYEPRDRDAFDDFKVVDLSADLGIGSDCGRVDFKSTLRSSLQNILDTKYFGNLGNDIIGSSPMLMACYFSPTWCAILKHSQLNANMLSQMRLNQCSIIDKYTDQRSQDFYEERQSCVRKAIEENGGDMERAMESCRGNIFQADLTNWAGGQKTPVNKLIDSSAKWAGLDQKDSSQKSVDLVKSLVGDVVVTKGLLTVDYGSHQAALSPRGFLKDVEVATEERLCGNLVKKVLESENQNLKDLISDDDLKALNPSSERIVVDRETIRSLTFLTPEKRKIACERLADSISLSIFSNEMNRSLDILSTLSQNPNLPENRRKEIEAKRTSLKDSVELTMALYEERNKPLNSTVARINEEAKTIQSGRVRDALSVEESRFESDGSRQNLMDCADGIMCDR
jgi:hypothetical protein